ncbi:hypothetical protein ANO14919_121420 [Xylariales sp. No.14919]|nr:hypothetical protein F5X98DRAFT_373277 [Xylaria grammica]GAW22600.1 hypothetical protein ANO14919_121420 [Xylariales sp. No.14919]
MKFFAATIILAAAAGTAVADSCNNGGEYCGQSLLNKGNYYDHIVQVLQASGQPTDNTHVVNSLFHCGSGGEIFFQSFCGNGCAGVGSLEDDTCL